ncbi:hypothetical protein BDFB_013270, partial [Asbolus verrucosus]
MLLQFDQAPVLEDLPFNMVYHIRRFVWSALIDIIEQLRDRFETAAETIRNNRGMMERVQTSLIKRFEYCLSVNGGHFEHI